MRITLAILILAVILPSSSIADDPCKALEPSKSQDIEEVFKGKMEGEISGLIGRLTGANADIEGEYKKFNKDTLKDYDNNHKLYVWERTLYLICIKPEIKIDINELLNLYMNGPSANLHGAGREEGIAVAGQAVELGKCQLDWPFWRWLQCAK